MLSVADYLSTEDFVQECANPSPGVLLLACTTGDDEDDPRSRLVVLSRDHWLDFTISGDSFVSVDADSDGRAFVLCEGGGVVEFDWRAPNGAALKASRRVVRNDAADAIGPLRRLRMIGGDVFVVGTRGQAYRLSGDTFQALPRLLSDGTELSLKDISGKAADDLVVVTTDGVAAHFDGSVWRFLDLPTSSGLNSIFSLPDHRYAIAGYNSTVLVGAGDSWQVVAPPSENRNYYGVAGADGDVFVAYLGGVDFIDGSALAPLPLPPRPPRLELAFIRSGPDGVCSGTGHTVGKISSSGWVPFP